MMIPLCLLQSSPTDLVIQVVLISESVRLQQMLATYGIQVGVFIGYKNDSITLNTLRPRQNGRRFAGDTFIHIFLNKNVIIWNKISLKFVPNGLTRQHSTQSVGNMPPPSPRHLLPHVLQIMPRNPKYDQFQPKGHHNEENPQSMTKMPGNPKFYPFHLVKIASKLEKSTNCSHNLISSESGQDTSACKISGHFLNGFSRKCLETPNLTRFTKSK